MNKHEITVEKLNNNLPEKYQKLIFHMKQGRYFIIYCKEDGNKLLRWKQGITEKEIDEALKTCHE